MRDVNTVECDGSARRVQELGQQVKKSCFSGAVGADQRMNVTALDSQVDVIDGDKALEFFGEAARF